MTFSYCLVQLGLLGRCKSPAGPGQSPGGGPEGEAPRGFWGLAALQQQNS